MLAPGRQSRQGYKNHGQSGNIIYYQLLWNLQFKEGIFMPRPASDEHTPPHVLILYYSFSGQTAGLLNNLSLGLRAQGLEVTLEKLRPLNPPRFPVGSVAATLKMMLLTALRQRLPIREPSELVWSGYDLLILAGPTWSYNPSGPVLDFLDRFGSRLFKGRQVIPLISCRGYWRLHWFGLKRMLQNCGAQVPNRMVFAHPTPEPWRTIGVFLKIAGKAPERSKFLGPRYQRYGHSKEQLAEAERLGEVLGQALLAGRSLQELDLQPQPAPPQ
jgi:multimeric flavodoxin WrbA